MLPALAASSRGPYDAMILNVRVKVPPDLVVKGKDLRPGGGSIGLGDVNVTLGGDIHLEKKPDAPLRLNGQVTTVRGTYDFQGRRFDIQRDGRVRFEGVLPVDPALDVTATRLISGVEARVHVGGTARRPELTLTSRPPLDQADILALIVFNQPANQLGEGQQASLAERAGAIATGFVASKLANSIGNALNLDTFEIQTAPESTGGQGAQVTIGEQLGQRLFVKLTQGVGAENLSQFVIDYQLTQFLRLSTTITQGESVTRSLMRRVERSGVDLIFFFSY
jgi:translocation and assembly module TamB